MITKGVEIMFINGGIYVHTVNELNYLFSAFDRYERTNFCKHLASLGFTFFDIQVLDAPF